MGQRRASKPSTIYYLSARPPCMPFIHFVETKPLNTIQVANNVAKDEGREEVGKYQRIRA